MLSMSRAFYDLDCRESIVDGPELLSPAPSGERLANRENARKEARRQTAAA
jgi:hypothetical protein